MSSTNTFPTLIPSLKKTGKSRLKIDRLYKAMSLIEKNMEAMVEKTIQEFLDPTKSYSLKERAAALRAFSSMTLDKDRLREDLGIQRAGPSQQDNPLLVVLGGNVDLAVIKSLPSEEREKLILEAISGNVEKARQLLPPTVATLTPIPVEVKDTPQE